MVFREYGEHVPSSMLFHCAIKPCSANSTTEPFGKDWRVKSDPMPAATSMNSPEEHLAEAIRVAGSAEFFPSLTRYLQAIAPFEGIFVTRLRDRRQPEHVYDNVRAGRRIQVIDQYLDGAYLLDPFYDAFRTNARSRVLRLGDVAPDRFQHSTYFRRYYSNLRLRDELAIFAQQGMDSVIFYSIGRVTRETRFRQRDVAEFRRALPVICAVTSRHFEMPLRNESVATPAPEIADAISHFGDEVLTHREREIAGLILKGHSTASIAALTEIAVGTVKIHRKNLYRKLGISSQTELFTMFLNCVFA